jgi:hypothetical protein
VSPYVPNVGYVTVPEARLRKLRQRAERAEAALRAIHARAGAGCPMYEGCDHRSCAASHAVWEIADEALEGLKEVKR